MCLSKITRFILSSVFVTLLGGSVVLVKAEKATDVKDQISSGTTINQTQNPGDNGYVVMFDANGGENAPASLRTNMSGAFTIPKEKPMRTGYTFIDWKTKADGTGFSGKSEQKMIINGDGVLYARWAKNAVRTVKFNANGGDFTPEEIQTDENGIFILPNAGNKDGFTFKEWNTKAGGSGYKGKEKQRVYVNKDCILYAQWIANTSIDANEDREILTAANYSKTLGTEEGIGGNISYYYNEKTDELEINGNGHQIKDYNDETNRPLWDKFSQTVKEITIRNTPRIGNYAFSGKYIDEEEPYPKLERINLSDGNLKEIGEGAFYFVGRGHNIKLNLPTPNSFLDIGNMAFSSSGIGPSLTFYTGNFIVGDFAFASSRLNYVDISDIYIKRIGKCAFARNKLDEIILPSEVVGSKYNFLTLKYEISPEYDKLLKNDIFYLSIDSDTELV